LPGFAHYVAQPTTFYVRRAVILVAPAHITVSNAALRFATPGQYHRQNLTCHRPELNDGGLL